MLVGLRLKNTGDNCSPVWKDMQATSFDAQALGARVTINDTRATHFTISRGEYDDVPDKEAFLYLCQGNLDFIPW